MCGIAGIVRLASPDGADERAARILSDSLAHRGPDGSGAYCSRDGRTRLVHRRLAIIDPHERSAQPMSTPDGRFHLIYNGEVYNHRYLRERLERRGVALRTQSDTEVLLHLLAVDGPSALEQVRGMFALALWDERERTLLLARDRFGMKPLYIAPQSNVVAFASEIAALRRAGLAGNDVSAAGVLAYLSWGSIPTPLTWVRGVEPLEPGTWARWSADGAATHGVFADARIPYVDDRAMDETELRAHAGAAVRESVRAHLTADVPVGVFLSGGIDSGAIVSTARSVSDAELHTCTVVTDDAVLSEEADARMVAERFETTHHVLRVAPGDIGRDLDAIVGRLDQPTGDAVNAYYVSQAVSRIGIKAVLSGVGGDELFGGYPTFTRIPAAVTAGRTLAPVVRASSSAAALALPAWRAEKWRHFAEEPALDSAYRALRGFFMPHEIPAIAGQALLDPNVWASASAELVAVERRIFEAAGPEQNVAAVARMETRGFLAHQLLRDVDAMSMAHGLEVRMPFVDHELQRAIWPALGSHPSLRHGKRLLHDTLEQPLPPAIVSQPKRGFTLPFSGWMRGPLREATRDGLHVLAAHGWISRSAAADVWTSWEKGQSHWSRPWGLAILGRFLEQVR